MNLVTAACHTKITSCILVPRAHICDYTHLKGPLRNLLGLEGATLGHYHLLNTLGLGGMSEVYLAHDEHLDQDVAIKVVPRSQTEHIKRFQREIETLTALKHDHILPAIDFGEQGPWHYLVMPYLEQGNLRERLKTRGPLTQEEAGIILEQVASALQCAHDHGILHRDIKSSNILLRDDHYVYLADFGLAKTMGERSDITRTGYLMGTSEYMAPELAEEPASMSSDIYALGVLLYEMVTGQVPFSGSNPLAVYWKHLLEQPARPSLHNPALSPPVERVILRALEKDPHQRFATPQALAHGYSQALKVSGQPATNPILARTFGQLPSQTSNSATVKMMLHPIRPLRLSLLRPHSSKGLVIATLVTLLLLLLTSFSLGYFAYNSSSHIQTHVTTPTTPQIGTNRTQQERATPTPSNTPAVKTSHSMPGTVKPEHGNEHRHRRRDGGGGN